MAVLPPLLLPPPAAAAAAAWLPAGGAACCCCCCCCQCSLALLLLGCTGAGLGAGEAVPPLRPFKLLVLPATPKASSSALPGLAVLLWPALLLLPGPWWWLDSGLPLLLSRSISARTA
jgi:hypothetical protein